MDPIGTFVVKELAKIKREEYMSLGGTADGIAKGWKGDAGFECDAASVTETEP